MPTKLLSHSAVFGQGKKTQRKLLGGDEDRYHSPVIVMGKTDSTSEKKDKLTANQYWSKTVRNKNQANLLAWLSFAPSSSIFSPRAQGDGGWRDVVRL